MPFKFLKSLTLGLLVMMLFFTNAANAENNKVTEKKECLAMIKTFNQKLSKAKINGKERGEAVRLRNKGRIACVQGKTDLGKEHLDNALRIVDPDYGSLWDFIPFI